MMIMNFYDVIKRAKEEGRRKLLEHEAFELMNSFGLPVPKFGLARSPDEAVTIASKIGFPIVLKIVSPDIIHKSDVGGVVLNLKDEDEVRKGFEQIMNNVKKNAPSAKIEGVLVQEMVPEGLEVIVGSTRDRIFGPVVMFGLGGIFVEILKDVSLKIAPVTEVDVDDMMREIKSGRILVEGYRGMAPRDIKAIKEIVTKVSDIMIEVPEIKDIDLNPIMLYEENRGAKVADARVLLG